MKHLLAKIAPLPVWMALGLTGCLDHASLEGAACPCVDGYVCCEGECRTSCTEATDTPSGETESTDVAGTETASDSAVDSAGDSAADSDSGSPNIAILPCDLFEAAGAPCVAAHSTVRALRAGYSGPLYQLCKGTALPGPNSCKGESLDIGTVTGGYADAAAHTAFCAQSDCTITKVYDQAVHSSGPPNDLEPAPAGGAKASPDRPVNASVLPVVINGHEAYGMNFRPGMGFRAGCNGCTTSIGTDLATGDEPQTIYMVTSAQDTNNGCCFDYGNAETTCNNDHNGAVEALYFGHGVIWGSGSGEGPWVMADMEDGLYAGWENRQDQHISTNTSASYEFVTAVMVGDTADKNGGKGRFALYAGDAQTGTLAEKYDGIRPEKDGYIPMQKQGSLVLGIAGDNSAGAGGRFYEAAIVNKPMDKGALDKLHKAIVAARYGKTDTIIGAVPDTDPVVDSDTGTDSIADSETIIDTEIPTDTDSANVCTDVTPCGGDVVGTWEVSASCLTVSGIVDLTPVGLNEGCGATVEGTRLVSGAMEISPDGVYLDSTTTTGTETLVLPDICLEISGTRTTCDRLNSPLEFLGYSSVECTDTSASGGCTCLATIDQQAGLGVVIGAPKTLGTYTVSENTMTFVSGKQAYSYCIQGTTMELTPLSTATTGTITGTIALQKQ